MFFSINFVLTFHTIISHRILTELNGAELLSSNCMKLSLFHLHGNGKPISLTHFYITGINPDAILMVGDHYGHPLCPGLQPGPPSQTPGGLGQRY